MCGICGYTGKEIPGLLGTMMERMRHRGPDDQGISAHDNVHLGMVRLSIIDLAGGRQPMSNEDGSVQVVFNGEIYNYIELRQDLEARGHRFATASDTETIVHGYEEHGLDFLHQLNGMFAIALVDEKKQTLYVIRDRLGVKPLFYSTKGGAFVFGSEIKAVLAHPAVSRNISPEALSYYLSLRHVPAPHTIYQDVQALPPGHLLVWDRDGVRCERWYRLPTAVAWRDEDEAELIDRLDAILRDSVRIRMRSDVRFGAYLSGGIDSSTVVGIMTEFSAKPISTFSLGYADEPAHKQDAHFARLVARRYGTDHHELVMSWRDLRRDLSTVIRHLDQPFAGVTSSWWLTRFIRQHVTVALSGDGADDAFGSYGHHRLVGPLAALKAAMARGEPLDSVDLGFFRQKPEVVRRLIRQAPWEWRLTYAAFTEPEKRALLSPGAPAALRGASGADFLRKIYQESGEHLDELNRMLYLDLHSLLPNEVLYYSDMLSMAHSVEARAPFLDYRLVELAASIPGNLKIRGLTLKYILRRVAARYLPGEVLERPKEGFVLPNNTWLRGPLASLVRESLCPRRLAAHGLFQADVVGRLVEQFLAGDESVTFKVWTLLVFQLWYEMETPPLGS